jgi:hypothetical protein
LEPLSCRWAHFHNADADADGLVSAAELSSLAASVCELSSRDANLLLSVLELDHGLVSQPQLVAQLQQVSALRAMYWKQRCVRGVSWGVLAYVGLNSAVRSVTDA